MSESPAGLKSLGLTTPVGSKATALFSRAEAPARPGKKEKAAARALFEEQGDPVFLMVEGEGKAPQGAGLLSGRGAAEVFPRWFADADFVRHWLQFVASFEHLLPASQKAAKAFDGAVAAGKVELIDPEELPVEGSPDGSGEASAVSMLVQLDADGGPTLESMAVAEAAYRATGMPIVLWEDEGSGDSEDEAASDSGEEDVEILAFEDEEESAEEEGLSAQERVDAGLPPVAVYPAWTADAGVFGFLQR